MLQLDARAHFLDKYSFGRAMINWFGRATSWFGRATIELGQWFGWATIERTRERGRSDMEKFWLEKNIFGAVTVTRSVSRVTRVTRRGNAAARARNGPRGLKIKFAAGA